MSPTRLTERLAPGQAGHEDRRSSHQRADELVPQIGAQAEDARPGEHDLPERWMHGVGDHLTGDGQRDGIDEASAIGEVVGAQVVVDAVAEDPDVALPEHVDDPPRESRQGDEREQDDEPIPVPSRNVHPLVVAQTVGPSLI